MKASPSFDLIPGVRKVYNHIIQLQRTLWQRTANIVLLADVILCDWRTNCI
jgi:hypothetical protein